MNKSTFRWFLCLGVLMALYILVALVFPFVHTATFWVSFVFALIGFAVAGLSGWITVILKSDSRSRFYGCPIALVGMVYGGVQVVVSFVMMALAQVVPWWIPAPVYAVGLGAAVIGLIAMESVTEEIQSQDEKLKTNVTLMRTLQSKVNQMAGQSENAEIKALADEFRYSDPVSNKAIADAEADLAAVVDELQAAYVDSDSEAVAKLCRKASSLLAERNRLCKLNKH